MSEDSQDIKIYYIRGHLDINPELCGELCYLTFENGQMRFSFVESGIKVSIDLDHITSIDIVASHKYDGQVIRIRFENNKQNDEIFITVAQRNMDEERLCQIIWYQKGSLYRRENPYA